MNGVLTSKGLTVYRMIFLMTFFLFCNTMTVVATQAQQAGSDIHAGSSIQAGSDIHIGGDTAGKKLEAGDDIKAGKEIHVGKDLHIGKDLNERMNSLYNSYKDTRDRVRGAAHTAGNRVRSYGRSGANTLHNVASPHAEAGGPINTKGIGRTKQLKPLGISTTNKSTSSQSNPSPTGQNQSAPAHQ